MLATAGNVNYVLHCGLDVWVKIRNAKMLLCTFCFRVGPTAHFVFDMAVEFFDLWNTCMHFNVRRTRPIKSSEQMMHL